MTEFLRSNRYASVIIATAVLVVIGFVVGITRDDPSGGPGVVLRADEQSLQPPPTPFGAVSTLLPQVAFAPPPAGPGPTLGRILIPARPSSSTTATTGGGSTATTTLAGPATNTTTTPTGSTFGSNRIAYAAAGSLWTINADGSDQRSVGVPGYFPAWSPDHTAIAYSDADSPGGALFVATASGKSGVTTGVAKDGQPAWSPDGSKLAFARIDHSAPDGYSGIWVINRDGSNLRRIAITDGCFNRDPAWSPDGTKIAFWSSRKNCGQGTFELYVMNADGTDVRQIGTQTNAGSPAWSPDGKTIAFSCDGYGGVAFEICTIGADAKNARRVTNLSGDDTDPAWSPDGTRIAFRSERDGGGIFTMKPDGSDMKMLIAGGQQPSWR